MGATVMEGVTQIHHHQNNKNTLKTPSDMAKNETYLKAR